MTKKKPVRPSRARPKRTPPPAVKDTPANRAKAIEDLGINVPIYRWRLVGGRLECWCYGGPVLRWPIREGD